MTVDATTVKANASLDSLEQMRVEYGPEQYLKKAEEENDDQPELPNKGQKLSNRTHRSKTDPDAGLFRKRAGKTQLAYSHNVLMDNK